MTPAEFEASQGTLGRANLGNAHPADIMNFGINSNISIDQDYFQALQKAYWDVIEARKQERKRKEEEMRAAKAAKRAAADGLGSVCEEPERDSSCAGAGSVLGSNFAGHSGGGKRTPSSRTSKRLPRRARSRLSSSPGDAMTGSKGSDASSGSQYQFQ